MMQAPAPGWREISLEEGVGRIRDTEVAMALEVVVGHAAVRVFAAVVHGIVRRVDAGDMGRVSLPRARCWAPGGSSAPRRKRDPKQSFAQA